MTCLFAAATTAIALLTSAHSTSGPELAGRAEAPRVREIADLMLRDVAVAVYQPDRSIIYYNPRYLEGFSPAMQTFFLAHERAHIALKHTRSSALRSDATSKGEELQAKELAADCLAVVNLGPAGRQVSLEAMRFFGRQGAHHFDEEHPTGSARARNILECLPE
jgi:hypothetical protein